MIYIIDRAFAIEPEESCIIIKNTDLTIIDMTSLIGSLADLYCKTTIHHLCEPSKLLDILCTHFACTDKKHKYSGELYFIESRVQSPILHATFVLHDELIIWIDITEAMHYARSKVSPQLINFMSEETIQELERTWKAECVI